MNLRLDLGRWILSGFGALAAIVTFVGATYGVIELYDRFNPKVRSFNDEYIYLNGYEAVNDKFIQFLRENDGRTVEINTLIDVSPVLPEHYDTLHDCNMAYPRSDQEESEFLKAGGKYDLLEGRIYNVGIELPRKYVSYDGEAQVTRRGCSGTLQLLLKSEKTSAQMKHGGVGLNFVRLRGTFDVHDELSGANERLILTEIEV